MIGSVGGALHELFSERLAVFDRETLQRLGQFEPDERRLLPLGQPDELLGGFHEQVHHIVGGLKASQTAFLFVGSGQKDFAAAKPDGPGA